LPAKKQQELKAEAYACAPRICREGLERAKSQGKAEKVHAYEEAMIFSHIRRVREKQSETSSKDDA
jgi:hypothetical protein